MQKQASQELALRIRNVIEDFISGSPENTLQNQAGDKAFQDPLVGFCRGDDPLFGAFKDHVGPFHWTPAEAFEQAFPGSGLTKDEIGPTLEKAA